MSAPSSRKMWPTLCERSHWDSRSKRIVFRNVPPFLALLLLLDSQVVARPLVGVLEEVVAHLDELVVLLDDTGVGVVGLHEPLRLLLEAVDVVDRLFDGVDRDFRTALPARVGGFEG